MGRIEYVAAFVGEKPVAFWDLDLRGRTANFLRGLDPQHFVYIADKYRPDIGVGDEGKRAARAIRSSYSQGLEVLFALMGATIQAPRYPIGWLLEYRMRDLVPLIRSIHQGQAIRSKLIPPVTWRSIAQATLPFTEEHLEAAEQIKEGYARAWSTFAMDFLDSDFRDEYNSLKHGMRAGASGFQLRFTQEEDVEALGDLDPNEILKGSDHGSRYFVAHELMGDKHNLTVTESIRNWNPGTLADSLEILAVSIRNLANFIRLYNHIDVDEIRFEWPQKPEDFKLPESHGITLLQMQEGIGYDEGDVPLMSPEEIGERYSRGDGPDERENCRTSNGT